VNAPSIAAPWPLRDKVAFAGIGISRYGSFRETDSYGLGCEALTIALEDWGLQPGDIDGLIVSRIPSYECFAEILAIYPRF
jgi:3-oxoacyl-[acyl-carrier-protein] synthase III